MVRIVDAKIWVLRGGAEYSQLFPIAGSAPQLRMDSTGNIPLSLSGDFIINPNVDWLSDELKPVLEIDGDESPMGIYLPATMDVTENENSVYIHVEAYDRCWRVRDNRTESMIYFAAGTNYISAVTQLLVNCGVSSILATPTTETLYSARQDWPIGTSYLDIVNTLLAEINYKPLWFNADGLAVLEPALAPTAANIQHVLDKDNLSSFLLPQIRRTSDLYNKPNVIICLCSTPDRSTPLKAIAENRNPDSPLSIQRRGRRIASVINVNSIASQAALQAYADRLLFDTMTSDEVINVNTALLPGYGVADITALHYGDLAAICIETGWTMSLEPGGSMTHTLSKVVYNIDF